MENVNKFPIYQRKLLKSNQYKFVYNGKKKIITKNLNVFFRANNQQYNYFGFSISKKTGNSPQRHLFKRWMIENLKNLGFLFPLGFNFVLSLKPDHQFHSFNDVTLELTHISQLIKKYLSKQLYEIK